MDDRWFRLGDHGRYLAQTWAGLLGPEGHPKRFVNTEAGTCCRALCPLRLLSQGGALVPQLPNVAKLNACNSYQHIYAMLEYYEFSSILIEKLTNESSRNSEMPFT